MNGWMMCSSEVESEVDSSDQIRSVYRLINRQSKYKEKED